MAVIGRNGSVCKFDRERTIAAYSVSIRRPERHPAMRLRSDPVSLVERVASTTMAAGITVSTTLVMLAASRPGSMATPSARSRTGSTISREQLTYIVPRRAAQPLAAAHPAAARQAPADPARDVSSTRSNQVTMPHRIAIDSAPASARDRVKSRSATSAVHDQWVQRAKFRFQEPDSPSPGATPTNPSYSSGGRGGKPAPGSAIGFPRVMSKSIRFDSALAAYHDKLEQGLSSGEFETPSGKQSELDSQLRARAAAAIAAKGAGTPIPGGAMGGGISAPLPFGGPSREQRARDSAVNAVTAKRLERVRQRLDSAVAAERRTSSDSLAQLADSLRPRACLDSAGNGGNICNKLRLQP